jgi:acyl-homoserine lactone acylase PvdQ
MGRMRRVVITLATVVAVVVSGVAIGVVAAVRKPMPDTSGTVSLTGLDGTVTVSRDRYGIPSIVAGTAEDLFFAQGYVHAQDRFHEMDVRRRVADGSFSALVGPNGKDVDHLTTAMGLRRAAEVELKRLPAESRRALDAYTRGVNAYIVGKPGSALSLEYAAKSLVGRDYRPDLWTSSDSVGWARLLSWDLDGPLTEEIDRLVIARNVTAARVGQLYPGYRMSDSAAVRSSRWLDATLDVKRMQRLRDAIATVARVTGLPATAGTMARVEQPREGGAVLTSTVAASISLPSPWYQIRLRCARVTKACPYDVGGLSLSGLPGVVVGHNRSVAWGLGPALPSTARLALVPAKKKTKRVVVTRLSSGATVTLQWKQDRDRSNVSGLLALNRADDDGGVDAAADRLALPFALVWADASGDAGQLPSEPEPPVAATERSPLADLLVPSLLPVEVGTRFAEEGKDTLRTWNREMAANTPAAAYFAAVWRNVLALTFHDELPKAQWPDGSARWTIVIRGLLAHPSAAWWDDLSTPARVERRDDILRQAMEDARDELTRIRARDVSQWDWSDLHGAPLRNPTLSGRLFERGPIALDGSNDTVEATSWDAANGYTAVTAPAARLVMHVAAPDSSRWIVSTGASGHTFTDHYTDQADFWAAGRDLPWRSTTAAVNKQAQSTLTLSSPTR